MHAGVTCFVLLSIPLLSNAQRCEVLPGNSPCSETGKDGVLLSYTTFEDCKVAPKKCCYHPQKGCRERKTDDGPEKVPQRPKSPHGTKNEIVKLMRKKQDKDITAGERGFNFNPIPPRCLPPVEFPDSCVFADDEPYVENPPIEIPYCMRIPCSPDPRRQVKYDSNIELCVSQPGCYFDWTLYLYRLGLKNSILPGVPVCQYAIRSGVFQHQALKVISAYGDWYPYFTNCILEQYEDEIGKGPEGCELLGILPHFKIPPKLAGWKGITPKECTYINACWMRGRGCHYPVDVKNIVVKSGQRFNYNHLEVTHGRPKCQYFDTSSSYALLHSYHQCLLAGCTVDTDIIVDYYIYLFDIGNEMSAESHWKYWEEVQSGRIGAHNLEKIYWKRKPKPKKPKQKQPAWIPVRPEIKKCGYGFKDHGARPCEPERYPNPFGKPDCPYQIIYLHKYGRLTGSLRGCCDINPCYTPRNKIRTSTSGPATYFTEWSYFSHCSKTCGKGKRYKTRVCSGYAKEKCRKEDLIEYESCTVETCGTWSKWSEWEPCGFSCRKVLRRRICTPIGASCEGSSVEAKQCFPAFCS